MNFSSAGLRRHWMVLGIVLAQLARPAWGESVITREYWLKNRDTDIVIRALTILVQNPSGKRIMAGQGKHLVVTDFPDKQEEVTDLLTIIDQPPSATATTSDKQFLEMLQNGLRYLKQQKKDLASVQKKDDASSAKAPAGQILNSGVNSYDIYKSTRSIYAEEDARLMKQQRRIVEEPTLPSVGDLILKGIFRPDGNTTMALLAYGDTLFTARDGGLFERNRTRVKGVTSQIIGDRVILVGPDKIRREFKFKSTL